MIFVMCQNIKIDNELIKRPRHVAKLTDKINKKRKNEDEKNVRNKSKENSE